MRRASSFNVLKRNDLFFQAAAWQCPHAEQVAPKWCARERHCTDSVRPAGAAAHRPSRTFTTDWRPQMDDLVDAKLIDKLMTQGLDLLIDYGPKVLAALIIFLVGKWLARVADPRRGRRHAARRIDPMLVGFGGNIIYVALFVFVVLAALSQLGVQTTSFIAVVGAAGLAIGLALQGSLANFAAGVMLVFFRPFKVGDYVDAGGAPAPSSTSCCSPRACARRTTSRSSCPTESIIEDVIVNYSGNDTRRVDLMFGCGYGDDLKKVREVLEQMIADDERILEDPAPVIAVHELGDSSVNFVVRPWVNSADYWSVYWDFHEQVKLRFDEAGSQHPVPAARRAPAPDGKGRVDRRPLLGRAPARLLKFDFPSNFNMLRRRRGLRLAPFIEHVSAR